MINTGELQSTRPRRSIFARFFPAASLFAVAAGLLLARQGPTLSLSR